MAIKPKRLLKDDIIYEVNLQGLSMFDDRIPEGEQGTFKGAAQKVAYLKELGMTAVVFLPIHEFADAQNDDGNYFSPNQRYSSAKSPGGSTREFKEMVKVFHEADIKVFLDMVYDHTAVRNLIIDSLQYWAWEMGVDGFRLDLASILSISRKNVDCQPNSYSTIFEDISKALPSRGINPIEGVDLIAKPWGDANNIGRLDKFPWDWAVWNQHFGDIVKTSLHKDGISPLPIYEISKILSGSKESIKKRPWNSINYVVYHDNCNSLRNVFSDNQFFHLNGAVIREDQISWDQGGDLELQKKTVRNAFVLQLLSTGVPMFAGGDEVAIFQFVKKLIQFRKAHECLRPTEYFTGKINPQNGFADLTWHREDGVEIKDENWAESDFIAYRINAEFEEMQYEGERVVSIYIAYNRSPRERRIIFPSNLPDQGWYRVLDTDNTGGWMSQQGNFDGGKTRLHSTYTLHECSILVLVEKGVKF